MHTGQFTGWDGIYYSIGIVILHTAQFTGWDEIYYSIGIIILHTAQFTDWDEIYYSIGIIILHTAQFTGWDEIYYSIGIIILHNTHCPVYKLGRPPEVGSCGVHSAEPAGRRAGGHTRPPQPPHAWPSMCGPHSSAAQTPLSQDLLLPGPQDTL